MLYLLLSISNLVDSLTISITCCCYLIYVIYATSLLLLLDLLLTYILHYIFAYFYSILSTIHLSIDLYHLPLSLPYIISSELASLYYKLPYLENLLPISSIYSYFFYVLFSILILIFFHSIDCLQIIL